MALTYLSVTAQGVDVFTWLSNITITSGFITWGAICVSYLRFYSALKAQGIDRNTLPFKSVFQPYLAWICLAFFVIVGLGCGYSVFIHGHWSVTGFLTYYLNIPVFFALFVGWKIFKRTKFHRAKDVDLQSGRREIDIEDAQREEVPPKGRIGKVSIYLTKECSRGICWHLLNKSNKTRCGHGSREGSRERCTWKWSRRAKLVTDLCINLPAVILRTLNRVHDNWISSLGTCLGNKLPTCTFILIF